MQLAGRDTRFYLFLQIDSRSFYDHRQLPRKAVYRPQRATGTYIEIDRQTFFSNLESGKSIAGGETCLVYKVYLKPCTCRRFILFYDNADIGHGMRRFDQYF